jgi:hypothetical protein
VTVEPTQRGTGSINEKTDETISRAVKFYYNSLYDIVNKHHRILFIGGSAALVVNYNSYLVQSSYYATKAFSEFLRGNWDKVVTSLLDTYTHYKKLLTKKLFNMIIGVGKKQLMQYVQGIINKAIS